MSEITLMSFGYLFGLPEGVSTVIDARGLPNPYYVEALRRKTGLDPAVRQYVFAAPEAVAYYETVLTLLRQRIAFHERYDSPLKTPLIAAIGCSGGKHRSVSLTWLLAEALRGDGVTVKVFHRNLSTILVHCAGAVVYTETEGELRFAVVRSQRGFHGFPKGRIEPGKTEEQTALRAIREQIGVQARLIDGFRIFEVCQIAQDAYEQVLYSLAACEDQKQLQRATAESLSYSQAMARLELESTGRVLTEAYRFLNERNE